MRKQSDFGVFPVKSAINREKQAEIERLAAAIARITPFPAWISPLLTVALEVNTHVRTDRREDRDWVERRT